MSYTKVKTPKHYLSDEARQLCLFSPHPSKMSAAEYFDTRSALRLMMCKSFSIPNSITSRYFSKYFLLYWSGEHVISCMREGHITFEGTKYQVLFHRDLTRGAVVRNIQEQYAISFRVSDGAWNLTPIVLITTGNYKPRSF